MKKYLNSFQSLYQDIRIFNPHLVHPYIWISVVFITIITLYYLRFVFSLYHSTMTPHLTKKNKKKNEEKDYLDTNTSSSSGSIPKLRNVFDVSRQQQSSRNHYHPNNNNDSSNKPFHSSYYYAHNNPNSKGGYKDGLRMEDYVMNQPKLLARNGVPISSVSLEPETESTQENNRDTTTSTTSATLMPTITSASSSNPKTHISTIGVTTSIPINRYLWEDDGNSEGIAKLYFDTLPTSNGTSVMLPWEFCGIKENDVEVKLFPSHGATGLLVQIRHQPQKDGAERQKEQRYHLHIPQLYGRVKEIKTIVKKKRLIVKMIKEKERGNMKAWPQLPAKGTSSKDYIDEDLFRGDDVVL